MKAIFVALLCCIVLLGTATAGNCDNQTENVQDCIAECPFSMLEGAMYDEENRQNLWTTFHHPRKALPQYLVVEYSTNVTNVIDTYLWTSNSVYFVIPPHVFGFLSLFLGMLDEDHIGEVQLTLPENCSCWLNGSLYFTDNKCSVMNYIDILTEKLRDIGNVSSNPQSISNYQYQSSAVREGNVTDVYHEKESKAFFSFIVVFPILAIIAFTIIISSQHKKIRKQMMKRKQHQNFAALISLGLTFVLHTTILDGIAAFKHSELEETTDERYYSKDDKRNDVLHPFLITSIVLDCICFFVGVIWAFILCICQCHKSICQNCKCSKSECECTIDSKCNACDCSKPKCECTNRQDACYRFLNHTFSKSAKHEHNQFWWALLLLFIPPIWCLASHFGFVILAWSSFVRHSKSLTLLYVFIVTVMFLFMRQAYLLIVHIYYGCYLNLKTKEKRKNMQEKNGILVWAILLILFVGISLVGSFVYLMFGLWLLPVTELVEESPIYLYDSLQLIIVVLAILVSYELISFREEKIVKLLKKSKGGGDGPSVNSVTLDFHS